MADAMAIKNTRTPLALDDRDRLPNNLFLKIPIRAIVLFRQSDRRPSGARAGRRNGRKIRKDDDFP
jgi:hypothetical protein